MEIADIKPYIEKKLVSEGVHPKYPNLRIYNYTNKCQIEGAWDDITLQCRGLIINADNDEVLARPFPKFFNLEERDHDIPVDELPRIYEKYDGSLGILYWWNNEPWIATRGSFDSEQARWATRWFREQVKDIDCFHRHATYLFEIIYPENRIVVSYDYSGLVFLAVIDIATGRDYDIDTMVISTPIRLPQKYPTDDLERLKELERDNAEGFVILYLSTGLRIKVKFEEYKRLHRIVTGVSPKSIWDELRHGGDLTEILERVPDEFYKWAHGWKIKLLNEFDAVENRARIEYEDVRNIDSRKEQAKHIIAWDRQYSGVVFAMLDGKDYKEIIWRSLKPKADDTFSSEI